MSIRSISRVIERWMHTVQCEAESWSGPGLERMTPFWVEQLYNCTMGQIATQTQAVGMPLSLLSTEIFRVSGVCSRVAEPSGIGMFRFRAREHVIGRSLPCHSFHLLWARAQAKHASRKESWRGRRLVTTTPRPTFFCPVPPPPLPLCPRTPCS